MTAELAAACLLFAAFIAALPLRRRLGGTRPAVGMVARVRVNALARLRVYAVARVRVYALARAERRRAAADLALAADLLAAALRTGLPVDRAAGAVGSALAGPLGERLLRVSRALRLGATAADAWSYLEDVPGADRLIRPVVRSANSGSALARALTRLAEDLRSARAAAIDAAARRAGVLVVVPLGLCFLPAFVLAGLVPVIVAVLDDVF